MSARIHVRGEWGSPFELRRMVAQAQCDRLRRLGVWSGQRGVVLAADAVSDLASLHVVSACLSAAKAAAFVARAVALLATSSIARPR